MVERDRAHQDLGESGLIFINRLQTIERASIRRLDLDRVCIKRD